MGIKNCLVRFENTGTMIRKDGIPANELWLDVGNALETGCVDHHHSGEYESTLGALADHPEYLREIRGCYENGQQIVVHMHAFPDLDCISSWYAFQYYLEHGEDSFREYFGPGGEGCALVTYINDVDQGMKKVTGYPTLYAVTSVLQQREEHTQQDHRRALDRGAELLACALEAYRKTKQDLATLDLTGYLPESFLPLLEQIGSHSFEEEITSGRVKMETIPLWKRTENGMVAENVRAAVWEKLPGYESAYNDARKEGALLTVVPFRIRGADCEKTKAIVSIDKEKDMNHEYTLLPLAEVIEQMEQVEEERLYEQTGSYRRDHSEPRSNTGLLGKMPFAATSDPWFILSSESLFDAPRDQSLLDYKDILKVIRRNASAVKKAYTVEITGDSVESRYEKAQIPLSAWQEDNRGILSRRKGHVVIWAEVDASLIRQNNRMLEAYCLNLKGKPFFEKKDGNLYFADYRTCIYSDLDCTMVLAATYDSKNLEQLPVAAAAGLPSENGIEGFASSRLVRYIKILLNQRGSWLGFGTRIGDMKPGDHKGLEKLNSEILRFSARVQKEDMIADAFERELYQFIKARFGNDELKGSVMEEMKLVIDESRNKMASGFNWLSNIAVPFLLLTAMFEMGFLRFDSGIDLSDGAKWWGWAVVFILCIVLSFVLLKRNRKS